MFFAFNVAPYKRTFLRGFICDLIDNIVTEVKVVGIVQCYFFQSAVFIDNLITILFVDTHIYSIKAVPVLTCLFHKGFISPYKNASGTLTC